ncbi:hypothetical protein BD779DRAFT_39049 [Infundibulicybe gibba]|nr:hypothetical protein BD779DRAFT_39049 [Infundibulicybe gibba]
MDSPRQNKSLHWYKNKNSLPPFVLSRKFTSNQPDAPNFQSAALFPWSVESISTLFHGTLKPDGWQELIHEYVDVVAVASSDALYIFHTQKIIEPICVKLPKDQGEGKQLPADKIHIAWALTSDNPLEPLLIFSHLSLLYVFNIKHRCIISHLRGHGGAITSVAVHPVMLNIFCTTSRDFSTRIYDLSLSPQQDPQNSHWPPGQQRSLAGAAHGFHMTEPEGNGIGRCIIVLMGGRSGGHQAAVLGAAFHPVLPVVATCGLDRNVKIWVVHPDSSVSITRQDKPLFSSSRIHKARVLGVKWLKHDILLTYSAPSVIRKCSDDEGFETSLEPSQLAIWRWLGVDRFFPPSAANAQQSMLRGCASDYQESSSFTFISVYALPNTPDQYTTPQVDLYQSTWHDPIALLTFPGATSLSMINLAHLHPRKPPPFPYEAVSVDGDRRHLTASEPEGNERTNRLPGWTINTESVAGEALEACFMGMEGKAIVGVGTKGSIWFWQLEC